MLSMLKWLIRRRLAAFERANDYDVGYARDLLDADLGAFLTFAKVCGLSSYRKGVPLDAWYAAKLVGTIGEDCGPCTQLLVTFAERDGVPVEVINAVLSGDLRALPDAVVLAVRFARAVLTRDPELVDLQPLVVARWGRRGLVSLACAITSARLYPTMKYALGHGHACSRVKVGGIVTPVLRQAA